MNLTQLKYLKALIQYRSFSLAAEKLQITQPALSLQIAKLENEQGFMLVDRRKKPISLTSEGLIFYEKAVEILRMVEELKRVSYKMGDEVKGRIRMGIIPTVAPYLVSLFIDDLHQFFPGLQIEITEKRTEDIIHAIKTGSIDCGIIATPVAAGGVTFEKLFYERFYAYVSDKLTRFTNPTVGIDEIMEEDIWYLEEGNCFFNQVNSLCNINQHRKNYRNLTYRSSSIESLRRIVESQGGITFIPELATINIPPHLEELVKPIADIDPVREISLVSIRNNPKERQIEAVKEIILQNIPRNMKSSPTGTILHTSIKM